MSGDPLSTSNISPLKQPQTNQAQILNREIVQEQSDEAFNGTIEAAFNPFAMARRFKPLETKLKKKDKDSESQKTEKQDKKVVEVKKLQDISDQYQRRNPELQARSLLFLRSRVLKGDSREEILRKVLETYPDYSLADEALDFLIETADQDLSALLREAKEELNTLHGREVRAGRNMGVSAREFSSQGLGSPTALRDLYRDITGNPRLPLALFGELTSSFKYEKMKTVIDFLLHALGSDLKSKGPSISSGELHRLFSETRTLQAILGIYKFFKGRMRLIIAAFKRASLPLPPILDFELLSKEFIKILEERYPSPDKVLALAEEMGLSAEIAAQLIIYTQMRDAIRQVAPKLFNSDRHRQDLLMVLIETLEELQEQLEGEEEEEEEEEDKEKSEEPEEET